MGRRARDRLSLEQNRKRVNRERGGEREREREVETKKMKQAPREESSGIDRWMGNSGA
jgi:hypothetical protein